MTRLTGCSSFLKQKILTTLSSIVCKSSRRNSLKCFKINLSVKDGARRIPRYKVWNHPPVSSIRDDRDMGFPLPIGSLSAANLVDAKFLESPQRFWAGFVAVPAFRVQRKSHVRVNTCAFSVSFSDGTKVSSRTAISISFVVIGPFP